MAISLALILTILLLVGTSALGIFFARKNKAVKNFTSKKSTLLFVIILTVLVFFFSFTEQKDVGYSLGYTFGYVYLFSLPSATLGILFMNKFKFQKKEFWISWFFSLLWIFVLLIYQDILKN